MTYFRNVETLEELKTRTKVIAAVDTLEYLCRGGRVSKAAATIGNLANIKPIITVNPEGEVAVIAKCVGKNKSMSYILNAMQECKVSDIHFAATTGYGYNDLGRDTLEEVYAKVFHTEDAIVRPQLVSGTHALAVALSSQLRPGDELLSPVGKPYDTLEEVIGIRESVGSLAEYGVVYGLSRTCLAVAAFPATVWNYTGDIAAVRNH